MGASDHSKVSGITQKYIQSADKSSQPTLRSSPRSPVFEHFKTTHALNYRAMGTDRILIHRHQKPTYSSSLCVQNVRLRHEQIKWSRYISVGIAAKLRAVKLKTPDSFSRTLKRFFSSPN